MKDFVRNAWYVAAWSKEIGRELFSRRLLGDPVVMYRKNDGTPVALLDRCAHKLAPLSRGRLIEDRVQCGYHGMEYDCSGQCVHVPGQARIPRTARVKSFPVVERYNAIWIWMGDPALADADRIIAVKRHGEPGWAVVDGQYQYHRTNYMNDVENLLDPAHTTYVHKQTIGNPAASEITVAVEQGDDHVLAYRWTNDAEPPPIDRKRGRFSGLTDRCQSYYFFPPCVSLVDVVTMEAGQEHTEENKDRGVRAFSYKFLTPESENRTHFFWLHVRNHGVGDNAMDEDVVRSMNATFEEDNQILSAVQLEQEATGVRQYTGLAIDDAPVRAMKMIERMLEVERTPVRTGLARSPAVPAPG